MSLRAVLCMPSYRGTSRPMVKLCARLEQQGWPWPEIGEGSSHIGNARSKLASHFMTSPELADYDWTFWGDDDMMIREAEVKASLAYARRHGCDVLNILAVPGRPASRTIACEIIMSAADKRADGTPVIRTGERGRHYLARAIGFGLVFVHRRVFQELSEIGYAPECIVRAGTASGEPPQTGWEFFPSGAHVGWPTKLPDGRVLPTLSGEDYGFSQLCARAGIKLHVLTKYRCFHVHDYPYTIEDAFRGPVRAPNYDLEIEL